MFKKIILDTMILILFLKEKRRNRSSNCTKEDILAWATELIYKQKTNQILTPIYLEMIGGIIHGQEMDETLAFLNHFKCADEGKGKFTRADLLKATHLAKKIPLGPDPRRRDAVDCLIKAWTINRGYELRTLDQGMPRG